MTATQMLNEFNIRYDAIASSSAPGYDNTDVSGLLNIAQEEVFLAAYEAHEVTEKTTRILEELKVQDPITSFTTSTTHPNAVLVTLPTNLWLITKEEVTISYTDCNGETQSKRIPVDEITDYQYNLNLDNPFRKPDQTIAWRYTTGDRVIELIHDGTYSFTTYHLTYLKQPQDIDIDNSINSELPNIVHRDIVERAVRLATASISQDYNIKLNEQNIT